jgi:hypothetical protein
VPSLKIGACQPSAFESDNPGKVGKRPQLINIPVPVSLRKAERLSDTATVLDSRQYLSDTSDSQMNYVSTPRGEHWLRFQRSPAKEE